jgi:lysophospholipase L1-like esterase
MNWYEEDVKKLETVKGTLHYEPELIFYGSSSIRLWEDIYEDFKQFNPVNLGFGGATLAACVWFFDSILDPYSPRHIVCYAGDNDLGDGRTPEEVYIFFQQLLVCLHRRFPGIPFSFISIKPSLARRDIMDKIRMANQLIKTVMEEAGAGHYFINVFDLMLDKDGHPLPELFEADGLHMNKQGYLLWNKVLLAHLQSNFIIT